MTDKPEHPEGQASEQDQSLEAQLDALLDDLEATEPEMVPKDLRKHQPEQPTPEPVAEKPAEPTPRPQPVVSEEPNPQPVAQADPEPLAEPEPSSGRVTESELEALIAQAAGPQPKPEKKGLDPDDIAALASNMLDGQKAAAAAESQAAPEAEPVAAEAADAKPKPAKKGLDLDEIASLASSMLDKQIEDTIAAAKQAEAQAPPAEPEPKPQAAETTEAPEKPVKKGLDAESIASMASNMLDEQIQVMVAEAAKQREAEAAEQRMASAAANAASAASAASAAPESPAGSDSLSEDALGDQIQALLNHVQAQPDFGEAEADESPEAQTATEDSADVAPAAVQASAEPSPAAADHAASSDAGAVSIDEIDAMLAESAEQAIQQEPEPVAEVPGTDEILAAQTLEEDAQNQAATKPAAQPQAEHEEPEPAPQPAAVTPQPVGATAADVADELDEDDLPTPAPARAHQPAHDAALEPAAVVIRLSALKKAEQTLLRICGKVNRPLNRLSPEMKDTVGYVGIIFLLPALCLILYGLVF